VSSGSGSLSRYILVRILLIIPMLWVVLTMVFFMLRVAPGDPMMCGCQPADVLRAVGVST